MLPPNAAHAVGRSILNWQEATDGTLVETKPEDVRRQVQTWRALLTGERAAKDYLLSDDLIRTATSSAGRLGKAIIKAAWTWIPILVLAGGAAALSIWADLGQRDRRGDRRADHAVQRRRRGEVVPLNRAPRAR